MSSIIANLIGQHEAAQQRAQEERERQRAEEIERLKSGMKEYLGEFYTLLEERYQKTGEKYSIQVETGNNDKPVKIYFHIPAMPEHELAPIVIKWSDNSLRSNYYANSEKFKVGGRYFADLEGALAEARKTYPEYLEEKRRKRVEEFTKATPAYWNEAEGVEELYLSLSKSLLFEYPELEEDLRSRFSNWKSARSEHFKTQEAVRREQEMREAAQAVYKSIRLGYISELAEWMQKRDEILESNQAAAERIQKPLDYFTYTVYKLNYAIVSIDYEDGEQSREIETRFAYTLKDRPSGGYWDIEGKEIQFLQAFSLERMIVKPSSGILAKTIERGGVTLYFDPTTREEAIDEVIEELSPLPEAPKMPEELAGTWEGDLMQEARRLLAGELQDREELDF